MTDKGLFSGTITEVAPANGSDTTKHRGHIWFEHGLIVPPDPIILSTDTLNIDFVTDNGENTTLSFDFSSKFVGSEPYNGLHAGMLIKAADTIDWTALPMIHAFYTPYSQGDYLIRYSHVLTSGDDDWFSFTDSLGAEQLPNTWFDLFDAKHTNQDISSNGVAVTYALTIDIAIDDGAGAPVSGSIITKVININLEEGVSPQARDLFFSSNLLSTSTPSPDIAGNGWTLLESDCDITGKGCISKQGMTFNIIDSLVPDIRNQFRFSVRTGAINGSVLGHILRYQDANNYWEFVLTDTDKADLVLQINEINGGVKVTRASSVLINRGPITQPISGIGTMHFVSEGDDLYGQLHLGSVTGLIEPLTYTSAFLNTATKHGFFVDGSDTYIQQYEAGTAKLIPAVGVLEISL